MSVNVSDSFAESIFDKPSLELNQSIKAGDVGGVEVGTIAIWTKPIVPDGWLECNGQTVDPVKYPELRKLMAAVPDYRGRFAQGASANNEVGTKKEAGLPNIKGNSGIFAGENFPSGPFRSFAPVPNTDLANSSSSYVSYVNFDASRSNSIYGHSNTVQPPAVVVKYIIKAE